MSLDCQLIVFMLCRVLVSHVRGCVQRVAMATASHLCRIGAGWPHIVITLGLVGHLLSMFDGSARMCRHQFKTSHRSASKHSSPNTERVIGVDYIFLQCTCIHMYVDMYVCELWVVLHGISLFFKMTHVALLY